MKIYDKAAWHIDGGENTKDVVERFEIIFKFLENKEMLSEDGSETLEYAMDSSVSLNDSMINITGIDFLDSYYEDIIQKNPKELKKNLVEAYKKFVCED